MQIHPVDDGLYLYFSLPMNIITHVYAVLYLAVIFIVHHVLGCRFNFNPLIHLKKIKITMVWVNLLQLLTRSNSVKPSKQLAAMTDCFGIYLPVTMTRWCFSFNGV